MTPAVEVFGQFIKVAEGGKCGSCAQWHVYFVNVLGTTKCAGCAGGEK